MEGSDSAARNIASEARAIRNKNRAISSSQAIAQAYTLAKERGEFQTAADKPFKIGGFEVYKSKGKTKFISGDTPENALPPAKTAAGFARTSGMIFLAREHFTGTGRSG